MFGNECKLKVKTRTHRQQIIALLLSTWEKKKMEFLQLTSFFSQNFFDPAQVFWYVHVDVGDIRVVTVLSHVEGCNANCLPTTHQRTPRIALWGRCCPYYSVIAIYYYCCVFTLSLNGKTYLTESRFSAVSTSTEDVFGKCSLDWFLRPFPPTLFHLNNRHLGHLQIIRLRASFRESPSSHQTLCIIFQFMHHFWNSDCVDSLAH